MLNNIDLPRDVLFVIASYLTLDERYGFHKGFSRQLCMHLKYPRNYEGVVERPISYFEKTTKRKCGFRKVSDTFYVLRSSRSPLKHFLRFTNEVSESQCRIFTRLETYPNYTFCDNLLGSPALFVNLPLGGRVVTQNRYIAVCEWSTTVPTGYYTDLSDKCGKVRTLQVVADYCLCMEKVYKKIKRHN